jgi:hypothetical protein
LGPPFDQPLIGLFGLLDAPPFSLPDSAEIVSVSCAPLATLRRVSGAQLEIADLPGVQGRSDPGIVFVSVKHVPDQNCELAGGCDSGDVLTAPGADGQEEGTQRAGYAFMEPVVVHSTGVVFLSAVALIPWHQARFFAVLIGASALIGAIVSTYITIQVVRTEMTTM